MCQGKILHWTSNWEKTRCHAGAVTWLKNCDDSTVWPDPKILCFAEKPWVQLVLLISALLYVPVRPAGPGGPVLPGGPSQPFSPEDPGGPEGHSLTWVLLMAGGEPPPPDAHHLFTVACIWIKPLHPWRPGWPLGPEGPRPPGGPVSPTSPDIPFVPGNPGSPGFPWEQEKKEKTPNF